MNRAIAIAIAIATALAVSCSGQDRSHTATAPADPTKPRPEAPRLMPESGADLSGPIALPKRAATATKTKRDIKPVDLGSDRAIVRVNVPALPRGGSSRISFDGNKTGWVTRVPESRQLPAVAYGKGRVYVSGGFNSVTFYGLDATTGRIDWATRNLEDNGPTAAVFEDGKVLFNTESCTIFALDAKTGKRIWHKWLGDPTLAQVAVADGIVYSAHPSVNGPVLSAFKTKNGARVWTRYVGGELLATPVIAGDSVYASTIKGMTYRFRRKTGKRVWARYLAATTAPWIVGDELFVTRRHRGKEQQAVVSVASGKVVRSHTTTKAAYLYDVPTNLNSWAKVWAFEGSRPIVNRGVRYVAMGGRVHATDAKTGADLWVRRYAAGKNTRSMGSVALAGSQVVVSSRSGKIFGLDIDTGYTLWSYDLGRKVVAQPIVAKGWVYATTKDGYVIALKVGDKTLDGWHMFGGNAKHNGPV